MIRNQCWCIHIFALVLQFKACVSQRRIVNGTRVWGEPRFMAYFVKSEQSHRSYQGWTCGGAIISPLHILTAAACVMDVDHLYAVVGYNKYVSAEELHDDPCTKNRKKRVVKTCAPKSYNVQKSGWTSHDIGVAVLESALDFTDATYKIDCSYPPALVKVNFDPVFERTDTDVVAMGWGHSERLRMPHHVQDHNEEYLRETSLLIVERDVCKKKIDYDPTAEMETVLDENILCVQGSGNIDSRGEIIVEPPYRFKCDYDENDQSNTDKDQPNKDKDQPNKDKDQPNKDKDASTNDEDNVNDNTSQTSTTDQPNVSNDTKPTNTNDTKRSNYRRHLECLDVTTPKRPVHKSQTSKSKPAFVDMYENDAVYEDAFEAFSKKSSSNGAMRRFFTRRQGLCQNDHGGPLLAWMGVNPIVIGVASTNLYNKNFSCIPPNLFTSTMHNEWFIKCAVRDDPATIRMCQEMELKEGLRTNELSSNWINKKMLAVAPILNLQHMVNSFVQSLNLPRNAQNPPRIIRKPAIIRQSQLQPHMVNDAQLQQRNSQSQQIQNQNLQPQNSPNVPIYQKVLQNHQKVLSLRGEPALAKLKSANGAHYQSITPYAQNKAPQNIPQDVRIQKSRQMVGLGLKFRPQKDIVGRSYTTKNLLKLMVPHQERQRQILPQGKVHSLENAKPRWHQVDWESSNRRSYKHNESADNVSSTTDYTNQSNIFRSAMRSKTYTIQRYKWNNKNNQTLKNMNNVTQISL